MKQLKMYGEKILFFISGIIILCLLLSILNYFNIGNSTLNHILSIIFVLGFCMYSGITLGHQAEHKGYLEGLKIGALYVLLLILLNLIFFASSFTLERVIYYLTMIITCTIFSMIGINKKRNS